MSFECSSEMLDDYKLELRNFMRLNILQLHLLAPCIIYPIRLYNCVIVAEICETVQYVLTYSRVN